MNSLELKGGILEMVSKIQDESTLLELKEIVLNLLKKNEMESDFWDELDGNEKSEIENAIKEVGNSKNLISHKHAIESLRND